METFYLGKAVMNDYSVKPERFNNDKDYHARLFAYGGHAQFTVEGEDVPYSMHRLMNIEKTRFAAVVKGGDGPLSLQTEYIEFAKRGTPITNYRQISKDPEIYGFDCEETGTHYRWDEHGVTWVEGEGRLLDIKLDPFPITYFAHVSDRHPTSTLISRPCVITGTFMGKKISGIASDVRQFIPDEGENPDVQERAWQNTTNYLAASLAGIREDGRKEFAMFSGNPGHRLASSLYWIEGEEPVVDLNPVFTGKWKRLPYADDGTCLSDRFSFTVKDKTIHFEGKWGFKGWTKEAQLDRHGQSMVIGEFYEGDKQYKHSVCQTFIENMNCYDHILKDAGYEVVDE